MGMLTKEGSGESGTAQCGSSVHANDTLFKHMPCTDFDHSNSSLALSPLPTVV